MNRSITGSLVREQRRAQRDSAAQSDGRVSRALGRARRQHERDIAAAEALRASTVPQPALGPRIAR